MTRLNLQLKQLKTSKPKSTKKKTQEEVSLYFELHGYRLKNAYENSRSKMASLCPKGHAYLVSYELFVRGLRCPECSGNKKRTLEDAKKYFESEGYAALFCEYKNNLLPLALKCPEGHLWKTNLNNFKKGTRCPSCSGKTVKHTIEYVRDTVERQGYRLVTEAYVRSLNKIDLICPKGHGYPVRFSEFQQGNRCPMCVAKHTSKMEQEVLDWVKSYYPSTKKMRFSENGKRTEFDIVVPELKLAIEVNGIYWHSETFRPDKEFHANKMLLANKKGLRLITIFEDEWKQRNSQVKGFLLSVLRKNEKRVFARKTELKIIEKEIAGPFLDQNHIQGRGQIKIAYGLYFENELLGVITGNSHHRGGYSQSIVLNRLAFKSGVSVVGGSSKLDMALRQYAKTNGYSSVISWSDNRWSEGNVYKKLGYEMAERLPPDYTYVSQKIRISKQSSQKKHLLKKGAIGVTETEMANSLGYKRIWDCGKIKWTLNLL